MRIAMLMLLLACVAAAAGCGGPVEGVGIVDSYRVADCGVNGEGHAPLAYWLNLKADPDTAGSRDVVLYIEVPRFQPPNPNRQHDPAIPMPTTQPEAQAPPRGTAHDPGMDRHLLRGRKLRYSGRSVPGFGEVPAHVDTTAEGGGVRIIFDAQPVQRLDDMTVGKLVTFDGRIEPRKAWMERFPKEDMYQTWMLVATLPSGETVDISDRLLAEGKDFHRCLYIMRQHRVAHVRVVGIVEDAEWIHALARKNKFEGSQRDVRGDRFLDTEQLEILSEEPTDTVQP